MKIIILNDRKKWVKMDIALFSRVHYSKYCPSKVDVTDKFVAKKLVRPNKDYAFFGIYNNDKTKVKDIFTGEIYVCGDKDNTKCSKGANVFVKSALSYDFINSRLVVDCGKNSDLYIYSKQPKKYYDKVVSWAASIDKQTLTSVELKKMLKQINLGVHEFYMDSIVDADEYLQSKAERASWKVTASERDF